MRGEIDRYMNQSTLKNKIEMAFDFTAMQRIFVKDQKGVILGGLEKSYKELFDCNSKDKFERIHTSFCEWFIATIKWWRRKGKKQKCATSWGQAAKVWDIVLKVIVYYCGFPNEEISKKLLPWLHCPIDNALLSKLRKKTSDKPQNLYEISSEDIYRQLLSRIDELIKEINNYYMIKMLPVQFDDLSFRILNRDNDCRVPSSIINTVIP